MNIIKRFKAPTPHKYKVWGQFTKNISYALGVGLAGAAAASLPSIVLTITGVVIFITGSISAFCFAQVEKKVIKKKNKELNDIKEED